MALGSKEALYLLISSIQQPPQPACTAALRHYVEVFVFSFWTAELPSNTAYSTVYKGSTLKSFAYQVKLSSAKKKKKPNKKHETILNVIPVV